MENFVMRSSSLLMLSSLLLPALCPAADPAATQALSDIAKALNAEGLTSIQFSGAGHSYALGQAGSVDAPWPKFNDISYQRTVSFEPWASRLQRSRTQGEHPPRGGGGQPLVGTQEQVQVVAAGSPTAGSLADELSVTLPQAFVKAATVAKDTVAKSGTREGKRYTIIEFTAGNQARTRGWVNERFLIETVETTVDHPVLGDTLYQADFTDYRDFGGVKFPGHIVQKQGGYPVLELTVADVKANVAAQFPPASPAAPPAAVTSEQLGESIFLIKGGYAAVAVGFKDHITIIEGGQNDQRSAAVIAEAKRLFPGKPITELVNTHAHFDHLGGVRAYVAEGATIVTHASNTAYYRRIWANPHTLAPDRLAKAPRDVSFKTVSDKLTLTDGQRVVELYHLKDFAHHEGTLIAYLPKEKVLVQADAFNPPTAPLTQTPATINPFHQSLLANVERLGLAVERIVPIHLPADDRKVAFTELLTATGKNPAQTAAR
jgi:glyoxylase-like metal-dependent hydrolase (beta-lactamase superfamily II)